LKIAAQGVGVAVGLQIRAAGPKPGHIYMAIYSQMVVPSAGALSRLKANRMQVECSVYVAFCGLCNRGSFRGTGWQKGVRNRGVPCNRRRGQLPTTNYRRPAAPAL